MCYDIEDFEKYYYFEHSNISTNIIREEEAWLMMCLLKNLPPEIYDVSMKPRNVTDGEAVRVRRRRTKKPRDKTFFIHNNNNKNKYFFFTFILTRFTEQPSAIYVCPSPRYKLRTHNL
jgi:hypothetical protein